MTEGAAERAESVKAFAAKLGFDACGIAEAGPVDPEDRLGQWIGAGYHADMDWIARTKDLRQDPRLRMPNARSVVVVARNYYHPRPEAGPDAGKVARYAWGRDYHKVLRKPLIRLARFLDSYGVQTPSFVSIDAGPVMERAWAERAGVGWIGKNSLVLRRDIGSWFFLGVAVTEVELAPDHPGAGHCGTCRACLDACPTDAFVAEGVVDSNRCISYQTIENRGEIPEALHGNMGGWVFGCDICQEVCPWNGFAKTSTEPGFAPRDGQANPPLDQILAMDEAEFDARFAGTPIRRTKWQGIRRNARIVGKA